MRAGEATVVREAIDRGVVQVMSRRQAAAQRLLDAPDMAVPDVGGLRVELDEIHERHAG